MKNLLKVLLIVVVVSGLCGCGSSQNSDMTNSAAVESASPVK